MLYLKFHSDWFVPLDYIFLPLESSFKLKNKIFQRANILHFRCYVLKLSSLGYLHQNHRGCSLKNADPCPHPKVSESASWGIGLQSEIFTSSQGHVNLWKLLLDMKNVVKLFPSISHRWKILSWPMYMLDSG